MNFDHKKIEKAIDSYFKSQETEDRKIDLKSIRIIQVHSATQGWRWVNDATRKWVDQPKTVGYGLGVCIFDEKTAYLEKADTTGFPDDLPLTVDSLRKIHREGFTFISTLALDTEGYRLVGPADFNLVEFEKSLEVGEWIETYANQGMRPAEVLAILDGEALVEYSMPAGMMCLRSIQVSDVDENYNHGGSKHNGYLPYIAIAKKRIPRKWMKAMSEEKLLELKGDSHD